jgi:hypothetical protein
MEEGGDEQEIEEVEPLSEPEIGCGDEAERV